MGLHHNAFYTSTSIGNTCFQKWQLIPWHSGAADLECKINDISTEFWSHAKDQKGSCGTRKAMVACFGNASNLK
jgi:hypothetical protein